MPSNTVDNLKECMKQGAFFAGSRYIKNTPELEQFSKEVGYNVADENGQWYASSDLVQPVITNIAVDDKEDTIAITAENYLTIHWIANGKVIHVGSEIDLDDYSDEIGSYVRARFSVRAASSTPRRSPSTTTARRRRRTSSSSTGAM